MRVIGGRYKGRRLKAPRGTSTVRPTSDRVKEAIFNRIEHMFWRRRGLMGCDVLDLFCGSGGLGIEALSRGAKRALFVDSSSGHLRVVHQNLDAIGLAAQAKCIKADLVKKRANIWRRLHEEGPFDIIFADPPYRERLTKFIVDKVAQYQLLKGGGLLIVEEETAKAERPYPLVEQPGLTELEPRTYGRTTIRIWERCKE